VVLGYLPELAAAEPESPGVANVGHGQPVTSVQDGGQRRPHTPPSRVLSRPARYLRVGLTDGPAQRLQRLGLIDVTVISLERLDHRSARELTGSMTAEAVRDSEQPSARIDGILIALANQAGHRGSSGAKGDKRGHLITVTQLSSGRRS